jgi:hypothetical protein
MAGRIAYYGNIVKDGLVLDLDAAKRDSYPGSGTTWSDISGLQNNGTLINGPTFDSGNGGSIVFDGSNDYINLPSSYTLPNSGFTYSIWAQRMGTGNQGNRGIIISNRSTYIDVGFNTNDILFSLFLTNAQNLIIAPGQTVGVGIWAHYAATYNKQVAILYLNGIQVASANYNFDMNYAASTSFTIGQYDGNSYNFNGKIPSAQVYNRGLTAAEVLQNYNALKGRYGL